MRADCIAHAGWLRSVVRQPLVGVGEVDSCGVHLVEPLAITGHRVGEFDDVHDLGTAEAGDLHSSHEQEARC
jgi:hypothetical protein